jgi:hypothetical protein
MIGFHNLKHAEFREQAMLVILETLAHLPETQRNIFVWNHIMVAQSIRSLKGWIEVFKIEAMLDGISSTLCNEREVGFPKSSGGEHARRTEIARIGRIKTAEIQCCGRLVTRAV